uniref:Uncharacterized protein n=1 Tax=Anguilla anguilla TaxID=7936 RepID=A0A0E9XTF9_ANGAN
MGSKICLCLCSTCEVFCFNVIIHRKHYQNQYYCCVHLTVHICSMLREDLSIEKSLCIFNIFFQISISAVSVCKKNKKGTCVNIKINNLLTVILFLLTHDFC